MSETSSHKPVPQPTGSSVPSSAGPSSSARGLFSDGQQTVISTRPPVPSLNPTGAVPTESARLWEGEQLGQFVLQKFVGGGGMGIVFRALDTTLDREVAVKVLSRDQSADEETLRRFRNEAQSAARLNHDNIAHVFYVGEDRGVHYIVFEFIDGVNIRDLVEQQGPLPLNQALSYTYQIALALDHASQRSVIHRDIKPSNVLVTPDGKAKLVDMGLARLNLMAHATNDLTASGVTLGTFDYISPEQARDPRSADVRSDLYSLGCSFYFMLTGRPPFPEGTVLQKLLQHQADVPPDPRSLRPELPSQVTRILAHLLAKNPNERFQQPAELLEELSVLGHSLGLQLGESPPARIAPKPATPPGRWRTHVPWVVPLAALFLIVFALDLYWSASDRAAMELSSKPKSDRPLESAPVLKHPEVVFPTDAASKSEADPTSPSTTREPIAPSPSEIPFRNKPAMPLEASPPVEEAETPSTQAGGLGQGLGELLGSIGGSLEVYQQLARKSEMRAASAKQSPGSSTSDEVDLAGTLPDASVSTADETSTSTGRVLTVGDETAARNYTSLLAACSAATDGDTIELRYSGRRIERPLAISNIHLTVQAGVGFHPIVVFAPEADKAFPIRQMVSVSGGQLSVRNVHWEFDLPANSPVERSLFELQHCELLDFENCTFTVRGHPPYYAGVAFFEIKATPGSGNMGMGVGAMDGHVVNISLTNCVAHGEATLLRDADLQSVRLTWNDGLLATSERLIVTEGNSIQPPLEPQAEVILRHVTAVTGSGLVLMTNSQEEPHQMVVNLHCDDCILATRGSSAVVEQRGSASIDEFLARFQWTGDNDYFRGYKTFWQIMNSAGLNGSKQFDFDEWKEHWRFSSQDQFAGDDAVVWATPPSSSRPYHTHLASDYVLSASASVGEHTALAGAIDGSDAGARLPYLPAVPAKPTAASAADRSNLPDSRSPDQN